MLTTKQPNVLDQTISSSAPKTEVQREQAELEVLFTWQAPARPFKNRNKEVFLTAGAIVVLVTIILFFIKEFLLIAVILSIYFVFWVLNNVAPEQAEHQITNRGIVTGDKNYPYDELQQFWMSEKWDFKILFVDTKKSFPGRLMMLFDSKDEAKIKNLLLKYLPLEEAEKTWLDKTALWLQEKVPLES